MATITIEKKDIFWSYAGNFFKIATNILLLPLILRYLSDDDLGLWYVFASISQIIVLLDFGFAPALARNIAYVWCGATELSRESINSENNQDDTDFVYFKVVLYTCKYIYLGLSILALLILLLPGYYYIRTLSSEDYVAFSWIIYSIGVFLNFLYCYYTSFLKGVGALAENNIVAVVSKFGQIIFTVFFLYNGYGLIGVSISYLLCGVITRFLSRYYFFKYEDIKQKISGIRIEDKYNKCKELFMIIWHNASRDGLVSLSDYLCTSANTLLCSSLLTLSVTGSYGLSMQIGNMIAGIASIPYGTYMPKMQEFAAKGIKEKYTRYFSMAISLYIISFIVLAIMVMICLPIISFFKKNIEIEGSLFIVILIYFFVYYFYKLCASFISTHNLVPYTKAYVISSLCAVLLSFIMTRYLDYGAWGLVIAPLIISVLYNAWKWPIEALRICNINLKQFVIICYDNMANLISNLCIKTKI